MICKESLREVRRKECEGKKNRRRMRRNKGDRIGGLDSSELQGKKGK